MRIALAIAVVIAALATAPARAAEPYSWTGFYAGVSLGAGRSGGDVSYSDYPSGTFASTFADGLIPLHQAIHPERPLVGVLAGYNWQTGPLVLGLEADLTPSRLHGTTTYSRQCGCGFVNTVASQSLDWLATVRAKLGVAPADGWLLYGTIGFAFGRTESKFNSADDGGLFSLTGEGSGVRTGLATGAGGEYAITKDLTARVEYLHYDLGTESMVAPYTVMGFTTSYGLIGQSRIQGDIVRAAVTYRFQ